MSLGNTSGTWNTGFFRCRSFTNAFDQKLQLEDGLVLTNDGDVIMVRGPEDGDNQRQQDGVVSGKQRKQADTALQCVHQRP